MKKPSQAVLHGECILFSVSRLPKGAVKEEINGNYVIIANSEVTGNHHVVDLAPGVEFYKKGEKRFIKNKVPTTVRCVVADRHSDISLTPGVWEVDYQKEYDYFTEALRNVRD